MTAARREPLERVRGDEHAVAEEACSGPLDVEGRETGKGTRPEAGPSLPVGRWAGAALVLLGCALLAFDGRWNPRFASLPGPGHHGVHALEALGFAAAAAGVGLLWIAGRRRRR